MVADMDEGKIGTIIVKDMSRLGRDYLKVGYYTEIAFPDADVRFIAINNGVDSENKQDSDFTPFLNIINEWYAKDTSKKILAVFKAKGQSGKPLTVNPPYGYMKDPENKDHWLVDPEAAPVVKQIYALCVKGYGPTQIASELTRQKVYNPVYHAASKGIKLPAKQTYDDPYMWRQSTVAHILGRQEYLGHTINFRSRRKSYKQKKKINNPESEWLIFENTHEAIIDEETFRIVQNIRQNRRRRASLGDMGMLAGLMYCGDCGAKMYQVRCKGWEHEKEYFTCASYRKATKPCTSHQIRNVIVEELVRQQLKNVFTFAKEHENEFVQAVTQHSAAERNKALRECKHEYEQAKMRAGQIDTIIQRLYEDNVSGKISDDRFEKMSARYEAEQRDLVTRIAEIESFMQTEKENADNASAFIQIVRKYSEINELTATMLHEFVEKIMVYQAQKDEYGHRVQRIKIYYNFIGEIVIPDEYLQDEEDEDISEQEETA